MVDEQDPVFREHENEWVDQKVSRLWNYYSRTPLYFNIYFSRLFSRHLLLHSGLQLGA